MKLDNLMLTKQKFSKMIETNVKEKNMSYLDAVLDICEKLNLDVEDVKKYISVAVKSKLESEAIRLNLMIEKNNSLELE